MAQAMRRQGAGVGHVYLLAAGWLDAQPHMIVQPKAVTLPCGEDVIAERRQSLFHVGRSEVDVVRESNDRRTRGRRPEPIVGDDETFDAGGAQAGDFRDQSLPSPLCGAEQDGRGNHHHQQGGEREAFGEFDHAARITLAGVLAYLSVGITTGVVG